MKDMIFMEKHFIYMILVHQKNTYLFLYMRKWYDSKSYTLLKSKYKLKK